MGWAGGAWYFQITPVQDLSLHLKSGAFGFVFFSRLSHIGPEHSGQSVESVGPSLRCAGRWGALCCAAVGRLGVDCRGASTGR